MEKPNLNKIAWAIEYFSQKELEKANGNFYELKTIDINSLDNWNQGIKNIANDWIGISNGLIPYPEYPELNELLKEKEMEEILPDLRYLGFIFLDWKTDGNYEDIVEIRFKNYQEELIQVLSLFHSELGGLRINIKSLNPTSPKTVSINNSEIIKSIQERIFELYKEAIFGIEGIDFNEDADYLKEKDFYADEWGKYFEEDLKGFIKSHNVGRPDKGYLTRLMAEGLHKYLQDFTELKAVSGKTYSNDQARFIYRFLVIYGLVSKQNAGIDQADFIANNFLKRLTKHRPLEK